MSNNPTPTPDLSTLDHAALARMVGELQAQIDCGVSPRDGCLNPKQVCLMCRLSDANSIARERTKEACDLTAQFAAFKQALCQRGENPDELTPQKAFEFVQVQYDLLAAAQVRYADMRRFQDGMLRLMREKDEIATQLEESRAEVDRLRHDTLACCGASGFGIPSDHDGRLSDGSKPVNAIAASLSEETMRLRARAASEERRATNAERWRDIYKTQWLQLKGATRTVIDSALVTDQRMAALRWIQQVRAYLDVHREQDGDDIAMRLEMTAMSQENNRLTAGLADTHLRLIDVELDNARLCADLAFAQKCMRQAAENFERAEKGLRGRVEQANRSYAILQASFADLNNANVEDLQTCRRLRVALAQVEDLANAVIADATVTLTDPSSQGYDRDYQRGRRQVAYSVAAIVAASAETAGKKPSYKQGDRLELIDDLIGYVTEIKNGFVEYDIYRETQAGHGSMPVEAAADGQERDDGKTND